MSSSFYSLKSSHDYRIIAVQLQFHVQMVHPCTFFCLLPWDCCHMEHLCSHRCLCKKGDCNFSLKECAKKWNIFPFCQQTKKPCKITDDDDDDNYSFQIFGWTDSTIMQFALWGCLDFPIFFLPAAFLLTYSLRGSVVFVIIIIISSLEDGQLTSSWWSSGGKI